MVELLAPAGNFISLRAVLENGADAVYIGLDDYNMRANANNFRLDELSDVSKIANEYDARVYVCSNIILKEEDTLNLSKQIPDIASAEVDGIILSDIGLVEEVTFTGLEAHISVQENTSNSFTLKTLKKLGVTRAILSRELKLDQIKEIASKSPIETEIFIHGAMCMAISGRCFLSYGLYGRSANCGDCLQPCRKMWNLSFEEDEEDSVINFSECSDESFLINKSYDDTYRTNFFSPKDLCLIEHIPELMDSNVDAFKIEGRSRSADYAAYAVNSYRQAIDSFENDPINYKLNPQWVDNLSKVFNRGFDTGFYFAQPFEISEDNQSKYIKKDIGKVVNYYNKIQVAELRIWDNLKLGDEILIQGPTTGSINHIIDSMQINGESIKEAPKDSNVAIAIDTKLRESDFVYKLIERSDDND
ncbi:MAG: U32 family peptidase [archaeon]|nr:U32 family peptidase [archaeon]